MSKSSVWSSLKALGYDSKQLKADTGKTYQSVTEQQLQTILDVTEKHFKTDVPNWRNNTTNELQQPIIDEVVVTDDTVPNEVIIDEQVISASEVNLDSSDTTDTATFEVINQPIVTIPVEVNTQSAVIDDPWLAETIGYVLVHSQADEVFITEDNWINPKRLVDVSEKELLAAYLVDADAVLARITRYSLTNFQTVKVNQSSIREDIKQYFASRELIEFEGSRFYLPKNQSPSTTSSTPLQSSVTASTSNDVNVPEQVQQVSETSTEATETISSANEVEMNTTINEPVNSYAFSFQEQKLPITVLEVASNNNKRIEVVNLQDAYFVELRDDKLYVSYGLHIKTFKASNYRIVKAFNSLLNGSNFIHLRDLRENNRYILVNLNRVKTIERKKDKIVFHWNGLLTYPGVHKLSDWKVID